MRTTLPLLVLCACAIDADKAEDKLQKHLEKAVDRNDDVHHGMLHIDAPALGIHGTWAVGEASPGRDATPNTPFLSASVGKLFTAATVLVLVDEGVLSLDDAVTDWLPPEITDDLPVKGGAVERIHLGLLLRQRSGLPDYFGDTGPTKDGAPTVRDLVTEDPDRTWTPETSIAYASEHFAPYAHPGELFGYADTNYDLLGLVIEAATGEPFHDVVRSRVIDPLGLEHTWYHQHEPAPSDLPELASCWFDDHDVTGTGAMSVDWAGGGLATTSEDLGRFLRGLQDGDPIDLDRLAAGASDDAITKGIDYGHGLWLVRTSDLSVLLRGQPDMRGVSGVTGSFAYLIPEHDAVVTGTFDQTAMAEDHLVFLASKVLPTLARVKTE